MLLVFSDLQVASFESLEKRRSSLICFSHFGINFALLDQESNNVEVPTQTSEVPTQTSVVQCCPIISLGGILVDSLF